MLRLTLIFLLVSALSLGGVAAPLSPCALPCCDRGEAAPRCCCGDGESCCAAPSPAERRSPAREQTPPADAPIRLPAVDALAALAEPSVAQPDVLKILRAASDSPGFSSSGGRIRRHLELTVLRD